jgi:hypothetical protein
MEKQQVLLGGESAVDACARVSGGASSTRRRGAAASDWCATAEGKHHVFPLKSIDTLNLIRHLHVSCGARGGKNPD